MNCYRHQSHSAVGVCKACMKGICTECAVEIDGALACAGSCEETVRQLNEVQRNQVKLQKFSLAARTLGPLFLVAYGLVLVTEWSGTFFPKKDFGLTTMGALSVLFGVLWAVKAFKKTKNA